jgi:signal transduction histidine kinase
VHTSNETTIELMTALEDDRVAISVRDTSPGIPPAVLPHILERFYRGEVSRSGVSTGLGLAIAKELIEAQGARSPLKVRSGRAACSP